MYMNPREVDPSMQCLTSIIAVNLACVTNQFLVIHLLRYNFDLRSLKQVLRWILTEQAIHIFCQIQLFMKLKISCDAQSVRKRLLSHSSES